MGDHPEQKFEWALKNGDMDQVKSIVGKVMNCRAECGKRCVYGSQNIGVYCSLLSHDTTNAASTAYV